MRCKTAVGLCLFIVAVHMTMLLVLQVDVMGDLRAEIKAKLFQSPSADHSLKAKRSAGDDVVAAENVLGGRKILQDDLGDELTTVSPTAQCRTGHVQGLRPVCAFGCLRRLYVGNPSFYPPRDEVVPTGIRQQIVSMGGKLHNIHISMVSHITDMQWQNGIYGTVGEIGAFEGQMTKILSYNIDTAAGERLFVSDHFQDDATSRPKDRLQDVFQENVRGVNFHVDSPIEDYKLFLHVGSSTDISEQLMQEMDLPQFRFLSINGRDDAGAILTAMERASCMLRDGGVIVVGGVHNRNSQTVTALKHYFQRHGTNAFTPFTVARDKVYLTTTNWKDRAQRYFVDDDRLSLIFNLQETTTDMFGTEMSYLAQKR